MIIRRIKKERNFTVIDNAAIDDPTLSNKAIGLLVRLLRLPDDWRIRMQDLANRFPDGMKAIRSAFKELEQAGYAELKVIYDQENKRAAGKEWIVYECKQTLPKGSSQQDQTLPKGESLEKETSPKGSHILSTELLPKTKLTKAFSQRAREEKPEVPKNETLPTEQKAPPPNCAPPSPQSIEDVKLRIAEAGLNGDSLKSRRAIWGIVFEYMQTPDFADNWNYLSSGLPAADSQTVLKDWIDMGVYYDVKEFKLNKIKGWIRTAGKNNNNGRTDKQRKEKPARTVAELLGRQGLLPDVETQGISN